MATHKKRRGGHQKRSKSMHRSRTRNRGIQGESGRMSGTMGSEERE